MANSLIKSSGRALKVAMSGSNTVNLINEIRRAEDILFAARKRADNEFTDRVRRAVEKATGINDRALDDLTPSVSDPSKAVLESHETPSH